LVEVGLRAEETRLSGPDPMLRESKLLPVNPKLVLRISELNEQIN
jgi:hypothetical protein